MSVPHPGGPVRVCIVTRGDLFPTDHGAAVKIVRTAEALSRQGPPVCVVTDDRDRYLRFTDGRLKRVPFSPRLRAAEEWIPRAGTLAEALVRRLGYPEEEVFLYRPMFDPAWWLRAWEVGRREQIDVFQAEFPGYAVPALVAARLLPGAHRTSLVQHNVEWDRLAEFGHKVGTIRRIERALLRAVDDVIAVSADDRRRMVAAGLSAERCTVIPHGVDVDGTATARPDGIRTRHGVPEDAPLLFFHGTLHYWPNTQAVRFIAESLLPRLLPDHPDLRVMICGQSPPRYYEHPAIVFTGSVPDLAEHIATADLCVCPIDAGGGTRLKLLEYMAAGKATVSTTKGAEGIPYVDGEQLVIADGAEPFARAVRELLAAPARREALGRRARDFAGRFDWGPVTAAYRALYRGEGRGDDWSTRLARPPAGTLLLLINRGCNLRCAFCDLWDRPAHMPLSRVLPLLDQAVAIGTHTLVITGGEPLLHPDLPAVVRAAHERGLGVNITTNGTLLDRHWEALVDDPPDSFSVSIDGLEATHDRLRGRPGAWKLAVAAIQRIHAAGIPVSAYFTVTRDNVRELLPTWELATGLGADFAFWPVNDAPDLYLRTDEERALWREAVARIPGRDAARRAYDEAALTYQDGGLGPVRCRGLVDQYGVRHDGALLPCCVWGAEELVVGNVFDTPLDQLWGSAAVQRARARLATDGCVVGCYNHSLYEFTRATGEPFLVPPRPGARPLGTG